MTGLRCLAFFCFLYLLIVGAEVECLNVVSYSSLPTSMYYLFRVHFIENTITPNDNEVMNIALYLKLDNIGICNDHSVITSTLFVFSFDISECP